jgi:hypothetical protein
VARPACQCDRDGVDGRAERHGQSIAVDRATIAKRRWPLVRISRARTALFTLTANRIAWQVGLLQAFAFGVCTNVFWLLMFPAMGYGFFGAHGPEGTRLFVSSLVSHVFFGLVSGSAFV